MSWDWTTVRKVAVGAGILGAAMAALRHDWIAVALSLIISAVLMFYAIRDQRKPNA